MILIIIKIDNSKVGKNIKEKYKVVYSCLLKYV